MSGDSCQPIDLFETVHRFVVAGASDDLTGGQWSEFEQLLRENNDARHVYTQYVAMVVLLPSALNDIAEVPLLDEVFPSEPCKNTSRFSFGFLSTTIEGTLGYLSSDWLVSYLVAAVIFGVGSLITSHIYVSPPEQIVDNSPSIAHSSVPAIVQPEPKLVGQVTGLVDCHWSDSHTAAYLGRRVAAGDAFKLASGLAEITYDTGAKVLLQGPVTYQVDSPRGGFLSVGKLTARMEKKTASGQKSNFALFAVRTPTAIVTDLGTEFGVEVNDNGETRSHVFRGSVQLQQTGVARGSESPSNTIILHADEAASIRIQHGDGVKEKAGRRNAAKENELVLSHSPFDTAAFVRRLPTLKRVRILTFNTGIQIAEGKPDPHWRVVARSDDPKFKPRPATVTVADHAWYFNDIRLTQWISLDSLNGVARGLPNSVTYTFQTQFDLVDVLPDTAVIEGGFLVDNHVGVIRLNGKHAAVPEHDHTRSYGMFHSFTLTEGFVAGTNILEIDVENGGPGCETGKSPMGLRVELDGWVNAVENE